MKKIIRLTESDIHKIVQKSITKVLNEGVSEIEDVPTFDVFNENISLTEIKDILESYLYDKNDNIVGRLSDLHFKYDTNEGKMLGTNHI